MSFEVLLEEFSGGQIAFAIGLVIGLLYGVFAQQSQFCLRAACVEVWRGETGIKTVTWLLAFGAAMLLTQALIETGLIDTGRVRQLNNPGSLSGAIVGGLIFGAGMILCRGCASRMLILSATGNVRALVAGLVVTIVAQASYRGGLSPLREYISSWWVMDAHQRGFSHLATRLRRRAARWHWCSVARCGSCSAATPYGAGTCLQGRWPGLRSRSRG
jgi:uncharacterized membrane protein YedE/YeeE